MIVSTREQRAAAAAAASEQRRAARHTNLDRANEVKTANARVKDAVAADASWQLLVGLVLGERHRQHPHADRLRVGPLLIAAPGIGTVKARTIIRDAGVASPERRLAELSLRQRGTLAARLLTQRERLCDDALARFAQSPRHWRAV